MKTIIFLLFVLNTIFIGKYLSFAITKWHLFSLRNSICIARLRREQKCGDAIIATYNSVVTINSIWISLLLFCYGTNLQLPFAILNTITGITVGLLFLFITMRYVLIRRYSLDTLYNTIVDYKSKEEVVTADNDYEVRYTQTFREIRKELRYVVFWVAYLLCMHAYYYYIVYL